MPVLYNDARETHYGVTAMSNFYEHYSPQQSYSPQQPMFPRSGGYDRRDPDATAIAVFKYWPVKNEAKSLEAGRPIYDDVEIVEIRFAGSREMRPLPAHARSHYQSDMFSGEQIPVTYAQRFRHQYEQFKAHAVQTKTGTPLQFVNFIPESKRMELEALSIYTVEALATIDGAELKNLGYNGRELKNQAMDYIEASKSGAAALQMKAELEASVARAKMLQEDNELLKQRQKISVEPFAVMSAGQLRLYISSLTNQPPPVGDLPHDVLVRMAAEEVAKLNQSRNGQP